MEALIFCTLPSVGAYVLRLAAGRWQALVFWLVLCFCSFAILSGAGWGIPNITLTLLVASFIGGFANELLGGIGGILARDFRAVVITILTLAVVTFLGRMWMLGNENDHRNMVQGTIVLIVLGGVLLSLFGGKGGEGKKGGK